jgi:hypothetical protein
MTDSWHAAVSLFLPPTGTEELDKWTAPRRAAAIARIAKAVGHVPQNQDQLATEIFDACVEMRSQLDPLEGRKASERLRKVQRILKGVRKYEELIDSDPHISAAINQSHGVKLPPAKELLLELSALESFLVKLAANWRDKADLPVDLRSRRPSELEWLAGLSLPLVYERHFLRRAGRSRNAQGEVGGPGIRFIEATLKELGLSYSPESIARAFSRLTRQREEERTRSKRREAKTPSGQI